MVLLGGTGARSMNGRKKQPMCSLRERHEAKGLKCRMQRTRALCRALHMHGFVQHQPTPVRLPRAYSQKSALARKVALASCIQSPAGCKTTAMLFAPPCTHGLGSCLPALHTQDVQLAPAPEMQPAHGCQSCRQATPG